MYDSPNPNGHRGLVGAVDVVAARVRAPAGRMVPVGQRHLPDMARHRDRQASARVGGTGQDVGDGLRTRVARDPCQQDRGTLPGGPLQRERPAADDHQDDGGPGRDDRVEQLLLAAEEPEVASIPELAGGRVGGQPGSLRDDDDRDVGPGGDLDGFGDLGVGAIVDAGPLGMEDLAAVEPRPKRVQQRRTSGELVLDDHRSAFGDDPERLRPAPPRLDQRLEVDQVAVVAQELARTVRARPDDRDPVERGGQRQDAVVGDEHDRPAGELEADPRLVVGQLGELGLGRLVAIGTVEQAQAELDAKDPADGLVEKAFADAPGLESRPKRGGVGRRPRELEVHARLERHGRHGHRIVGQVVGGLEHLDPGVIGGDDAVEPPALAQDRGEQLVRGVTGQPVHVAVGGHDARQSRVDHRGLEREELFVAHLARAEVHRRLVEAAFGQAVADEVLAGGQHAVPQVGPLECPDVRGAELGAEVRVLAVGLLDATPARVAGDVEDRCQGVARPGREHPPADRIGHPADEVRVERRGRSDRLLEARPRRGRAGRAGTPRG